MRQDALNAIDKTEKSQIERPCFRITLELKHKMNLGRLRPAIPLWALFIATQAVDVLWGVFVLTGVEHARIVFWTI
jgi:hypothetical protein